MTDKVTPTANDLALAELDDDLAELYGQASMNALLKIQMVRLMRELIVWAEKAHYGE